MAEEFSVLKNFLTCSVCTEIFKDPVSLGCHHSFCSMCLQAFWDQAQNKNCPTCKRKSSKDNQGVNFSMKELANSYSGRRSASSSEAESEIVRTGNSQDIEFHTDERAVCSVDELPQATLAEQVSELKLLLRPDLMLLKDRRIKYQDLEKTYDDMVPHLKKQLVKTERRIRAQFEQLHQILREEEEARVAALREEEAKKRKMILLEKKTIQEQISSLSAVEEGLQKDGMSFLTSYKHSWTSAKTFCAGSDLQLLPGGLLDEAKHLGNLAHRVWVNVEKRITFTPIILDPNTAGYFLSLSDDLTSVRNMDRQKVPRNPERFTRYTCVLGYEGFSSGIHCWEVEVGDHPIWRIGVAKESVDRKGERTASPENGIWSILNESGKYTIGSGKKFTLKKPPEKIRVQLDYDVGEVSFYDPEDMTLIYTFQETFTENLYPYFTVGAAGKARTTDIKVCVSELPSHQL